MNEYVLGRNTPTIKITDQEPKYYVVQSTYIIFQTFRLKSTQYLNLHLPSSGKGISHDIIRALDVLNLDIVVL